MPAPPGDDAVVVGRITGTWGLHGDLKVEPLTDLPSRFAPGSVLYLNGEPARVERSRSAKAALIVKLDTITGRAAGELQRDRFLTVPRSEVQPPAEGTYYYFQIIGMSVWSDEGEHLGRVKEILSTGSNDVYVVDSKDRRDLLIPARAEVVREVSVREGKMTVRLPDGLRK